MKDNMSMAMGSSLKIGICDDERKDREKYAELIRAVAERHNVPVDILFYESGAAVSFEVQDASVAPDILFMDIAMPNEDGISVSRRLREPDGPICFAGELIFLTKSDQHAIEAFDVGAFHYIVKGQTPDSKFEEILLSAFNKAWDKHKRNLLLRGVGEYRSIDVETIHYFEIQHRIVTVYYGTPETTFQFYCSMDKLEQAVFPFGILRVHKSFIVQIREIESLTYSGLKLYGNVELPVGRAYYNDLKLVFDSRTTNKAE